VSVLSAASNLPEHIRRRQAERADFLIRKRGIKARIEVLDAPSPGRGTMVFVCATYRCADTRCTESRDTEEQRAEQRFVRGGFTGYGRLRKPAERVAEDACKAFFRYHKRRQPVDAHLADQLLLPLSVAAYFYACTPAETSGFVSPGGPTDGLQRTSYALEAVTRHLVTQAWVIQQFLGDGRQGPPVQIRVEGQEGQPGTVTIQPAPGS
jgi:RNA 3'-terminal phosphate cyclase (ATP)